MAQAHGASLSSCFANQIVGWMSPIEARNLTTQLKWISFLHLSWKNTSKNILFCTLMVHRRRAEWVVRLSLSASHCWLLDTTQGGKRIHHRTICVVARSSIMWTPRCCTCTDSLIFLTGLYNPSIVGIRYSKQITTLCHALGDLGSWFLLFGVRVM